MRVILDECLPRRLLRDLPDHAVTTVPRCGWSGTDDGPLISLIAGEFDVFVTMDTNVIFQQDLSACTFCIIVLHATSNRYESLAPMIPALQKAVTAASVGQVEHLNIGS